MKSRSEKQDLERDINGKTKLISSDDPRIKSGWTHAIAADALFALGGITGLLGLYYALRSPGPDSVIELSTKNYAIVPVVGATGVGLAGRF